MAAAAHDVGRAEDHGIAQVAGHAGSFAGQRKLRHAAAQLVVVAARGGIRIVVRGYLQAGLLGAGGQFAHSVGHRIGRRHGGADAVLEDVEIAFGAVGVLHQLALVAQAARHAGQVVVQRQEAHAAVAYPLLGRFQAADVVRFEAQVHIVPRAHQVAHSFQRVEHAFGVGLAAQAAFPGQRDAVEFGGDAVGQQLAVHVEQGAVIGKRHTGPRHDGAFEGVAVQVHDAGQHQQIACIEPGRAARRRGGGAFDQSAMEAQAGLLDAARRQDALACDTGQGRGGVRVCVHGVTLAGLHYNQMSR